MEKARIISEIQRTAQGNDGKPLGTKLFQEATGIGRNDWRGIHWARWGDALSEAGFEANAFGQAPLDENSMLEAIAELARQKSSSRDIASGLFPRCL